MTTVPSFSFLEMPYEQLLLACQKGMYRRKTLDSQIRILLHVVSTTCSLLILLTINSNSDTFTLSCSCSVISHTLVDEHSNSCHCSVPHSKTVTTISHQCIILKQLISLYRRVTICRAGKVDHFILTDFYFTCRKLEILWFVYNNKQIKRRE